MTARLAVSRPRIRHYHASACQRLQPGRREYLVKCGRTVYDDAQEPETVTRWQGKVTCKDCKRMLEQEREIGAYLED